jgi:hypothetical protein
MRTRRLRWHPRRELSGRGSLGRRDESWRLDADYQVMKALNRGRVQTFLVRW